MLSSLVGGRCEPLVVLGMLFPWLFPYYSRVPSTRRPPVHVLVHTSTHHSTSTLPHSHSRPYVSCVHIPPHSHSRPHVPFVRHSCPAVRSCTRSRASSRVVPQIHYTRTHGASIHPLVHTGTLILMSIIELSDTVCLCGSVDVEVNVECKDFARRRGGQSRTRKRDGLKRDAHRYCFRLFNLLSERRIARYSAARVTKARVTTAGRLRVCRK